MSLRRVAENFQESAWEEDAQIFLRRYSGDTRPWIPFHTDKVRLRISFATMDFSLCTRGTCENA